MPINVPSPTVDPRGFLRALLDTAIAKAVPGPTIAAFLPPPPKGRTVVLGAGKAGGAMAAAVEALWPANAPMSGLVVTRYDAVPPAFQQLQRDGKVRIEVVEAAHPVPDAAGREAAARIAQMARGLTADDLVLCLMSGGASSLLVLPADGISLEEKQAVNKALLRSGAAIGEMNTVRKHLSAIKGGRLAAMCAPARVVTLLISDVPGDAPETIGSGPTVPDPTTCADTLAILARHIAHHGEPFAKPCVVLSGGETTVTVRNKSGRGGRATEFLLGSALALQGEPGVWILADETDGIDGVEDNAGAIVTPDTLARAAGLGLKARDSLDRNDAYGFFGALGDLVVTGPTYTNVNDFRAMLIV